MADSFRIPVADLILAVASAADLVSPAVADHHKRVAYIADSLAAELALATAGRRELAIGAALHDIGAFSLKDRLDTLRFEMEAPHRHAELGYRFLREFEPLAGVASIIRFHHVPWESGAGETFNGLPVPDASHLLHLADRVDVLARQDTHILQLSPQITARIEEAQGSLFIPEHVAAYRRLAEREYFWLDLSAPNLDQILRRRIGHDELVLDAHDMAKLAMLLSHIIDFKSPFTVTHSAGVAATAEQLARLAGFSGEDCQRMLIAGYLHDLGKLAVPAEILEKPSSLTPEEFDVVKIHTYQTRRILDPISDLTTITGWAASHHERLDGNGYPFHHSAAELSRGARIMAVADVFTAISEDRPYRAGMPREKVVQVLTEMGQSGKLDIEIVQLLLDNHDQVDAVRIEAQRTGESSYRAKVLETA